MKNDINLLFKRKVKSYSSKNVIFLLLIILVAGIVAYVGIALPSGSLNAVKKKAAAVSSELSSSSVDQNDLTYKTGLKTKLDLQIAELTSLDSSRSDILNYIEAVKESRPSTLFISMLTTNSANTINLLGRADSDKTVALFCLRLREKNMFKNVFLTYSTTDLGNSLTSFAIVLTLPSTLDSETIIKELEHKDDVTANAAAAGGGK